MTINFNPQYSSSAFVSSSDCGLGVTFMGPFALLCELELRSGNSRSTEDSTKRAIRYMQAMGKALDQDPAIFYAKSFQRDDLGTAELVLRWRDSIRRYGWTPFIHTESEKLRGLAEVENHFHVEGPADRWRFILDVASKQAILSPTDTINVTCAKEDLEPMLQELMDAIEAHGTSVIYNMGAEVSLAPQILSFKNDTEVHEWIARQNFGSDDVLVGANRGLLNDMLYALGKPLVGNTEEGIGPVMRIFTLGLSLFSNPVDIINLLAYLQLPKNPLNALHVKCKKKDGSEYMRSLARILADVLCRQGGIGYGWDKNIAEAIYDWEGNELEKDRLTELRSFIGMWENTDRKTGLVSREAVANYTALLGRWARGHFKKAGEPEDDLDGQYHALASFCETMKLILEGQNEMIAADKVSMWAGRIIRPITLAGEFARKGSINMVGSLGNIHSAPEHIIWVSAETRTDSGYEFSYLSQLDKGELAKHGIAIPEREHTLKADRNIAMNALSLCKSPVTIITCERCGAEQTTPNLIVAELTQKFGLKPDTDPFIAPPSESYPVKIDTGKKCELRIPPFNLDDYEKIQSASSIEKLINHPFDYYVANILGLTGYGSASISDEVTMRGNIAHGYMKDLGDKANCSIREMIAEHARSFDARFDKITRQKGILLLSEEKAIEYSDFKTDMRDSISNLLKLISDMKLSIVAQEYPFQVELEPFGQFKGFIDCLLRDENGDYVIFDFKYGWQRYYNKINEGRAVQLSLYRKAIQIFLKANVSFCGYYSFLSRELYSADTPVTPGEGFEPIQPIRSYDTFTQVCNSYLYRKKQFAEGILEEGDGLPLNDLQYFADMQNCDLLHLEYEGNGTKQYAYGNENMILKGDLR